MTPASTKQTLSRAVLAAAMFLLAASVAVLAPSNQAHAAPVRTDPFNIEDMMKLVTISAVYRIPAEGKDLVSETEIAIDLNKMSEAMGGDPTLSNALEENYLQPLCTESGIKQLSPLVGMKIEIQDLNDSSKTGCIIKQTSSWSQFERDMKKYDDFSAQGSTVQIDLRPWGWGTDTQMRPLMEAMDINIKFVMPAPIVDYPKDMGTAQGNTFTVNMKKFMAVDAKSSTPLPLKCVGKAGASGGIGGLSGIFNFDEMPKEAKIALGRIGAILLILVVASIVVYRQKPKVLPAASSSGQDSSYLPPSPDTAPAIQPDAAYQQQAQGYYPQQYIQPDAAYQQNAYQQGGYQQGAYQPDAYQQSQYQYPAQYPHDAYQQGGYQQDVYQVKASHQEQYQENPYQQGN